MAEELTTARILREDQQAIEARFGKPTYRGLHKLLQAVEDRCEHPEDQRDYTTALVNGSNPGAALNVANYTLKLAGFRCRTCGRYIFPDPEAT
jgi:hypothetical protein